MLKEFPANQPGVPEEGLPSEGDPTEDEGLAQLSQEDVGKLKQELEDAEAQLAKGKKQAERDISNVRSSLDQRHSRDMDEMRGQLDNYETRMHQTAMSSMDDAEKVQYELQVERNRRERLETELAQARGASESAKAMNQYAQGFMELGVKYENLDFTNPEALYASGWEGVAGVRKSLLERIDTLENPVEPVAPEVQPDGTITPVTPVTPVAPKVMVQHGQQPSATKSIGDVITALTAQYPDSKWTEDKVVSYVERGLLPKSIVEGVDWNLY